MIEVGVASGTPELYETFPEATYLLVEPLAEFEHEIKAILQRHRGLVRDRRRRLAARARSASTCTTTTWRDRPLLQGTMGPEADGRRVTVPMVVVDELVRQRTLAGPILLKVRRPGR